MSTREDLARLCTLPIDFEAVGLMEPGVPQEPYFCTPVGAEYVGRLGCDGGHFILLPGDERVFCVEPSMGEPGTYVLPVGADLREFLAFLLFCRDANPLSQLSWMDEGQFRALLAEDRAASWAGCEGFFARKEAALAAIAAEFALEPRDPFAPLKAIQAAFDPVVLHFSDEYYDTLGIERNE